jgi:hypothetical protein
MLEWRMPMQLVDAYILRVISKSHVDSFRHGRMHARCECMSSPNFPRGMAIQSPRGAPSGTSSISYDSAENCDFILRRSREIDANDIAGLPSVHFDRLGKNGQCDAFACGQGGTLGSSCHEICWLGKKGTFAGRGKKDCCESRENGERNSQKNSSARRSKSCSARHFRAPVRSEARSTP